MPKKKKTKKRISSSTASTHHLISTKTSINIIAVSTELGPCLKRIACLQDLMLLISSADCRSQEPPSKDWLLLPHRHPFQLTTRYGGVDHLLSPLQSNKNKNKKDSSWVRKNTTTTIKWNPLYLKWWQSIIKIGEQEGVPRSMWHMNPLGNANSRYWYDIIVYRPSNDSLFTAVVRLARSLSHHACLLLTSYFILAVCLAHHCNHQSVSRPQAASACHHQLPAAKNIASRLLGGLVASSSWWLVLLYIY